jgi:hypothetical protein
LLEDGLEEDEDEEDDDTGSSKGLAESDCKSRVAGRKSNLSGRVNGVVKGDDIMTMTVGVGGIAPYCPSIAYTDGFICIMLLCD